MTNLRREATAILAALAVAVALFVFWGTITAHLATFFGFNNGGGNSSHYLFWSGAGSDLAYLSFLVAGLTLYRKHNCHKAWCPRIGKFEFEDPVDGVKHMLCWKHHPDVKHKTLHPEAIDRIAGRRRHLYLGKQPGRG
jgi:hypothetical protein